MTQRPLSVAGANTLLGQHLLARLATSTAFQVVSLHDELSLQDIDSIADSPDWNVCQNVAEIYRKVPLLASDAPALAPLLASFLPDKSARKTEAAHLNRGTQIVTHAEYARLTAPLVTHANLKNLNTDAPHIATPNCTTAMCAPLLDSIHARYRIQAATITALQAISGTDLPGMQAHAIHDQVVGHLPGEAEALRDELARLFVNAFPIHTFATRVPVWRGHTLTVLLSLQERVTRSQVLDCLRSDPQIHVASASGQASRARPLFHAGAPTASISDLRIDPAPGTDQRTGTDAGTGTTLLMTMTGDNLEAATTGLMQATLEKIL